VSALQQRVAELERELALARQTTPDTLRYQRAAIEYALDGIAFLDAQGAYTYMNQAHAEGHGYDHPQELIGRSWTTVIPEDQLDLFMRECMAELQRDGHWRGEVTCKRRDGSLHPTDLALRLMDGGGYVCIVRDASRQKQADTELKRSQDLLESERLRLHEQIIETQAAALAELSTPLIPITDTVVVMPLIGKVDARRVEQVIEALLTGIAASKARTAILDVTGVPVVDTQVANGLVSAAKAVRLLGAQVVLTGIRPEVAQTLVGLGVDLSGIVTSSTLQRGVAQALGKDSR
jgi:rsbT co-antagonist protein RsbR